MNNVKGSPIVNGNSITSNYQVVEFRDIKPNGSLTSSGNIIGYGRIAAYELSLIHISEPTRPY